jgi:hypothetical protein
MAIVREAEVFSTLVLWPVMAEVVVFVAAVMAVVVVAALVVVKLPT